MYSNLIFALKIKEVATTATTPATIVTTDISQYLITTPTNLLNNHHQQRIHQIMALLSLTSKLNMVYLQPRLHLLLLLSVIMLRQHLQIFVTHRGKKWFILYYQKRSWEKFERTYFLFPSKHTTSFQCCNNFVDVRTTLLQRQNDVVCLLGCFRSLMTEFLRWIPRSIKRHLNIFVMNVMNRQSVFGHVWEASLNQKSQ